MSGFAGYDMPIEYKDLGVKKESINCRSQAVIFDVSHMGQLRINGKDRVEFMEKLAVGDISHQSVDNCTLSLILNAQGGIIDDIIFSNNVVLNAGNKDIDMKHIQFLKDHYMPMKDVTFELQEDKSLVALQGPLAQSVLQQFVRKDLSHVSFMQTFRDDSYFGKELFVSRTGYTGEDGFEISIPHDVVEKFLDKIFENKEVTPAGLAARDSLRLEAGLCLHGHEITEDISPVEAMLQWTIREQSQFVDFYGKDGYLAKKNAKPKSKRCGLVLLEKGVLREHCGIFDDEGNKIGETTSGTFSHVLNKGIGQAYVLNKYRKVGTPVNVQIRKRLVKAEIMRMPFVETKYYRTL